MGTGLALEVPELLGILSEPPTGLKSISDSSLLSGTWPCFVCASVSPVHGGDSSYLLFLKE